MSWGRSVAIVAAMGLGTMTAGVAAATTPPGAPTTSAPDTAAPSTTVAPGVVTGPTPPRAGSATGGLVHDAGATDWDLRRIATLSVSLLAALAVAGHLYGRMQSTTPVVGRNAVEPSPRR